MISRKTMNNQTNHYRERFTDALGRHFDVRYDPVWTVTDIKGAVADARGKKKGNPPKETGITKAIAAFATAAIVAFVGATATIGGSNQAEARGLRNAVPTYRAFRFGNQVYRYGLERQGRGSEYAPIGSPQFFQKQFPNPRPNYDWMSRNTYGVFGRPRPCLWAWC